jgi:hypothetical protein
MSDAIRLITRGDDAGSARSANVAIRDAFQEGILRNVSVMAPTGELAHAAEMLAGLDGLCCGMHVTLTCEWDQPRFGPVLGADRVPSIVEPDGTLPRDGQALHDRKPVLAEMVAEVRAQLDLLRSKGFDVRYLDMHMGVGWVGGLDDEVRALADAEGLLVGHAGFDRLAKPDGQFASRADALAAALEGAGPGTYLTVAHPCYDDEEMAGYVLRGRRDVGADRDDQRRMFMDPVVLDVVKRRVIEPIRYDEA